VSEEEPYLRDAPPLPAIESCWVGVQPYSIGRNSYVGEFTHISQNVHIGKFTSIGNLCTIGAQKHPLEKLTTFPFIELLKSLPQAVTTIGSDVWIGSNSVILAGVTVCHGAVIGAGSVVTKDIPPYAIVAGNPARVLRHRFAKDLIAELLMTHWWDLPAEVIKKLPMQDPRACLAAIERVLLDNPKPMA
jgi:acetyltransferase-like isoleucine patch superfamily enzyme